MQEAWKHRMRLNKAIGQAANVAPPPYTLTRASRSVHVRLLFVRQAYARFAVKLAPQTKVSKRKQFLNQQLCEYEAYMAQQEQASAPMSQDAAPASALPAHTLAPEGGVQLMQTILPPAHHTVSTHATGVPIYHDHTASQVSAVRCTLPSTTQLETPVIVPSTQPARAAFGNAAGQSLYTR